MKLWIIAAIVIGLLLVASIAISSISLAKEPENISCKSCGNSCTAEKNCGSQICGAVNGGTCGCGKQ